MNTSDEIYNQTYSLNFINKKIYTNEPAGRQRAVIETAADFCRRGFILTLVLIFAAAASYFHLAGTASGGALDQLDKLKKAENKMKEIKRKRFAQGESLQYSRSNPIGPLDFYDPRDSVKVIKITDGCVKKLKKFPDADMVADVCDYMLRSGASAVGIEMLYETPSLSGGRLHKLLLRTTRVALASEVTLDPDSYFKNWGAAAREFNLKLPYRAFNDAARKKGYVNFDDTQGFARLRCRTFLIKNKELFLSMPLALIFIKENASGFDIVKSAAGGDERNDDYSKLEVRFNNLIVPEAFIPQCAYTFSFEEFSGVYEKARNFIKSPDPKTLTRAYDGRIILIGDGTQNAKTYILKLNSIHNIDILANCITEIYNANEILGFNEKNLNK